MEEKFVINLDRVEELKSGRTLNYIASLIGFSYQYLSEIFLRKRIISRESAEKIIDSMCKDVVSLKERLNNDGIDNLINYFFNKM